MNKRWFLTVIISLCVGILAGYCLHYYSYQASNSAYNQNKKVAEKKIKYWVAPMNPKYHRDKPGKSPMGMDLVPVYAEVDGDKSTSSAIKISPQVINNLSITTAKTKYQRFNKTIETVGYVTANEDNIENVHSYIDGWVRNLKVASEGDKINKGQVLFQLYSPSLINAQQEFILALQNNNRQLINASRKKLRTLGLTQKQIADLQKSKVVREQIDVYAKVSGIVSKLNIRDGVYVKPDKELMVIEDLSSIWIRVDVYERQAQWVQLHQTAIASFTGLPNRLWQGEVIYIHPKLNKKTHTLAVRLQFPNPYLTLKPNMYAAVKIFVPSTNKQLIVPASSVITTQQGSHVIRALGDGRFEPQRVTLGDESNGNVVIIHGLEQGDEVVTSGQFLIDSESNLTQDLKRLQPLSDNSKQPSPAGKSPSNEGTVLAINLKRRTLTLSHAPIEALGMPEMVMELPVASNVALDKLSRGQKIIFKLKKLDQNHYQIISIVPI